MTVMSMRYVLRLLAMAVAAALVSCPRWRSRARRQRARSASGLHPPTDRSHLHSGAQSGQPAGIRAADGPVAYGEAGADASRAGNRRAPLQDSDPFSAALLLVAISFAYGVLHAAGPGHGKAVISSYVLADGQTVRRGILLSFMAALIQALSALVLVAVLILVLRSTGLQIKAMEAWLETLSWGFVAVVGAWLLYYQLRSAFAASARSCTYTRSWR